MKPGPLILMASVIIWALALTLAEDSAKALSRKSLRSFGSESGQATNPEGMPQDRPVEKESVPFIPEIPDVKPGKPALRQKEATAPDQKAAKMLSAPQTLVPQGLQGGAGERPESTPGGAQEIETKTDATNSKTPEPVTKATSSEPSEAAVSELDRRLNSLRNVLAVYEDLKRELEASAGNRGVP